MGEGVGDVEEEGVFPRSPDETLRLFGVEARQPPLILHVFFQKLPVPVKREGFHVVAVRHPEEVVEAVVNGVVPGVVGEVSQVPLPHHPRPISPALQGFGQGQLRLVESPGAAPRGEIHEAGSAGQVPRPDQQASLQRQVARLQGGVQHHPDRIPSREKTGPGRRANGITGVEVGETHPLLRQPVDVGGPDDGGSVAGQVAESQIVGVDEDEVGRPPRESGKPLHATIPDHRVVRPPGTPEER